MIGGGTLECSGSGSEMLVGVGAGGGSGVAAGKGDGSGVGTGANGDGRTGWRGKSHAIRPMATMVPNAVMPVIARATE